MMIGLFSDAIVTLSIVIIKLFFSMAIFYFIGLIFMNLLTKLSNYFVFSPFHIFSMQICFHILYIALCSVCKEL